MKKLSLLLFLIGTISMSAQLSGVYTINSGTAASASNYTSFTAFANAINSAGVSGAVTVNVVANSGPYNEQVTFNQYSGGSATNSVLINGNNNSLTFSSANSGQPWTLLMNGADYMSFNNLTINALGTYAYGLVFVNGSDYNKFNTVKINCPANSTSSDHIPVVFSGANSNYYTASNSGSYNTLTGCTLKYGYFSVVHYGLTGPPYNSGNSLINCSITDWYYYGVYSYYAKDFTISGCTIDRPTHPNVGFGYGMYMYYNQGFMINGNRIKNFWGGAPGNTNGSYPIYVYYNPLAGTGSQQNTIQNNIISDMNNNSYVYGIYSYYQNGKILNNTIVLNNPDNTYTGTFYGMYAYAGGSSYPLTVKNNLLYFNMSGASTSYGIYFPTSSGLSSDNNNYYMANQAGTQYVAYHNGDQSSLANLISSGSDANSKAFDPQFISPSTGFYMPYSYALDNKGANVGVTTDILGATRASTPDIGAIEFLNVPCSGTPAVNAVVSPTAPVCLGGSANLSLLTTYTLSGLNFQWQASSTGSAGVYSAVSGATNQAMSTPTLGVSTWYRAVITCTNGGASYSVTPAELQIAGTTTNTTPFAEGFEGLNRNNQLPNCSWLASNTPGVCKTYTSSASGFNRFAKTGTGFASFASPTQGTGDYFYTSGIQLNAGATYSMSINYIADGNGSWNEFSVLYGTTPSTTGLTSIASLTANIINNSYNLLTNTFVVPSSGLYYIAVKAISGSNTYFLSWDDLSINAPCFLNNLALSVNSGSVCAGQSFTMVPSGAVSYTYSSGSSVVTPSATTYYTISGTSNIGCVSVAPAISFITVAPLPLISASSGSICAGSSFTIQASGANSYTYSSGSAVVTPTGLANYSVTGTSANGCVSSAPTVVTVTTVARPVITVSNGSICAGGSFTLSPSGASSYTYSPGFNAVVNPTSTSSYSITGTNAQGCTSATFASALITVNPLPVISVNSGSVCSGNAFTLSPSGASTYSYSSGTSVISPTTSGIYFVSGTSSLGCVSATQAVAFVAVNATPTITASGGSVCAGLPFLIQPNGANNYTFSGGSATVNPGSTTTYSVTGASLAGCVSPSPALVTINVEALPVISVNSGTICSGASFSILPTGANTYTIQGGSNSVSPSVSSTYTVTGTSTAGCISQNAATSTITVNATPTLAVNSGSICEGQTFTIAPSGANTYTIQGGNNTVTPSVNSTYTVSGTSSAGCISQNVVTSSVTVNPNPSLTVNSGSICEGQTFTIVPAGANTYTIQGGSNLVTPSTNSTYTVTGTNMAGCVSQNAATSSVTVNTNPSLTVNSGSICQGQTFSITPSGANTYTIQGGSNTVSPLSSASYTVSGTNSNGCVSQSIVTSSVTVLNNPTITVNSGSICSGQSFTLLPGGANTYTIEGGNTVVSPGSNTNYSVSGTNTNGCVAATAAIATVSVSALPTLAIAGNTALCVGESVTLSCNGANTYSWSTGSSAGNIVISPAVTTTYNATGTNTGSGCQSSTSVTVLVNECLGMSSLTGALKGINIYPNPNNGRFYVETEEVVNLIVTDVIGKTVLQQKLSAGKNQIELGTKSKGIYSATLIGANSKHTFKVIISE